MQTSGLLRLLDRNRAQGSRALREGKGPAQRARPEEVVHVPSGGTARTNHSRHTWEDKARALPLTRPFGRSCDFGGRSCSKIMKLLLKVEAAGIEPGQFDDLDAVSPRHLAQVRDPPREMSGLRALSRATKANSADSVDQRDHGGFVRRNLRLGNEAVRHQRFFLSEHESPRSCDFLHVFRERYRAPGSTNVHADSRVSCAQRVPRSRPNTGRASLDVVQVAALLGCSFAHVYDL